MASVPEYVQTLASGVMHDLGELQSSRDIVPRLRDAQRFAAARAAEQNLKPAVAARAAAIAIRDWRATQRVKGLDEADTIERAYVQGRASIKTIGARVRITLTYARRKPPGAIESASILINARSGTTVAQIIASACQAWNNRALQVPHGYQSGSRCNGEGEIVQVVEGGWSHAQI